MAKNRGLLSLSSRGLKHKLMISAALMSVLPLLVSSYIVSTYVLPRIGLKIDILLALFISIVIAAIGFFVTKEVFDRVLTVTSDAKLIADGDLSHRLSIESDDEVGDLGDALNKLTQRIRSNMDELKTYGERTAEINLGIQKKVIVLSSLLQISSQISQSENLDDILKIAVEKARLLANSDLAYLFFRDEHQEALAVRVAEGSDSEYLMDIKIDPAEDVMLEISKSSNKAMVLDKENASTEAFSVFVREKLNLKNTLALPVYLRKRVIALLGVGNTREDFSYSKEDAELLDIFSKQIAIAVENDILTRNVRRLEVKDSLTGLYNEAFMRNRLSEEIKRAIAYRRPCSFIVVDIDNFKKYNHSFGSLQAESAIKRIASLIRESVTEIDRVGRIGDDEFAVILPEKNKREAQEVAENIRGKVEFSYSEYVDPIRKITVSAGVSENPLDGITSEELVGKARELLEIAKNGGRNRVIIFKDR
ncbi:MAG: diguanylate cyclase [Candidatus Omnitrophica bacterium]|nr:diguanylate cyclase [Candidatus Omnitrophota bacterium]